MVRSCFNVSPMCLVLLFVMLVGIGARADTNAVYSPCMDTTVLKNDGFTFGLAIGSNYSFFVDRTQYSPCDSRLQGGLSSGHLALFRPKVDEITLLLVNYTELDPENIVGGGFGVAFAGKSYAAVSAPHFLANSSYRITSLSLVLNFEQGRLQGILWKNDNCKSCQGNSTFVCVRGSVQFQVQIAKKLEVERTAVSASNSHGLAQIVVNKF